MAAARSGPLADLEQDMQVHKGKLNDVAETSIGLTGDSKGCYSSFEYFIILWTILQFHSPSNPVLFC